MYTKTKLNDTIIFRVIRNRSMFKIVNNPPIPRYCITFDSGDTKTSRTLVPTRALVLRGGGNTKILFLHAHHSWQGGAEDSGWCVMVVLVKVSPGSLGASGHEGMNEHISSRC